MSILTDSVDKLINRGVFLGGPATLFEMAGRKTLMTLLEYGLLPDSKVLDMGCGCLRGGYWLIRFLEEGCYFGIEPNKTMLQNGIDVLLSPAITTNKQPVFNHNTEFDAGVFNQKFDYFLARSIWTHAAKSQIIQMLDSFVLNAKPGGIFLTSYLNATKAGEEYLGVDWVGKSHESQAAGIVKHSIEWVQKACEERGLDVSETTNGVFDLDNSQKWLVIKKVN